MDQQTKRLTVREKQRLEPLVKAAQYHDEQSRNAWDSVGMLLDSFGSRGHSQCCPIGGMRTSGRNGISGTTPCPCGWGTPENVEDVLRRMIAFVNKRLTDSTDVEASDLITDALSALNRTSK